MASALWMPFYRSGHNWSRTARQTGVHLQETSVRSVAGRPAGGSRGNLLHCIDCWPTACEADLHGLDISTRHAPPLCTIAIAVRLQPVSTSWNGLCAIPPRGIRSARSLHPHRADTTKPLPCCSARYRRAPDVCSEAAAYASATATSATAANAVPSRSIPTGACTNVLRRTGKI